MYLFPAYFNYIDGKVVIILSFWDTFMFGVQGEDPNQDADQQVKDHDKGNDKDPDHKTRPRKKRKNSK